MRTGQREDQEQVHQDDGEVQADDDGELPRGRRIRGLDAEQRRAQRRAQLLEAAMELFARQSYARTTIEQICQTAFVGTKGFYEVFDSKEACYLALLREITQDAFRQVEEVAAAEPPGDEHEAARRLVVTFAHAMTDDPRKVKVSFGEGAGISPEINRQRRDNRRRAAKLVESIWERYGADVDATGASRDLHPMAVALIGGLFDLVVDWVMESEHHAVVSEDAGSGTGPDIDSLIADLTSFYMVVRNGLAVGDLLPNHPA